MNESEAPQSPDDEAHLRRALELAAAAAACGEVPIGAVLVSGDLRLEAKNEKESRPDATAHAEMLLIRQACETLGVWRLSEATLYVTKEPCVMCAGALLNARVARLVIGTLDDKAGAVGSRYHVLADPRLLHEVPVTYDVRAAESAALLGEFFRARRM